MSFVSLAQRRCVLLAGAAFIAVGAGAAPAVAHTAEATADAAATAADQGVDAGVPEAEDGSLNEIVVTGSNRAQRQFDASYAVSVLNQETVQKLAPTNISDLISRAPGIYSESTGGEVQNVYRLRGIPDEGSFVAIQEDGVSLYPENSGTFFKTEGLTRFDLMTEQVEIVRGGPSPIYSSNAAAIVNFKTRHGTPTSKGAVRATVGDTELYRLDGYYSGPVNDTLSIATGGFYRYNKGYRDLDFRADQGGQFRLNLTQQIDRGSITVSFKYLDDKNAFYLPIPLADPRDASVSLDGLFDRFNASLSTAQLKNARILSRENGVVGTQNRDLSNGRHMRAFTGGLDIDKEFGEGWLFTNKFRFTDISMRFDALYSTRNPQQSDTYANSFRNAATAAFGPVASFGYRYTDDGSVFDPATTRGLVVEGQYRAIDVNARSVMNDTRLSKEFELLGKHDLSAGVYAAYYRQDSTVLYQDYLFETRSNPRLIDLVALNAAGQVVGSVTDSGVVRYATNNERNSSDVDLVAFYGADNWQITPKLRLEGGIRHEIYKFKGLAAISARGNLSLGNTLADDATTNLTANRRARKVDVNVTNWTIGVNYDLFDRLGVYARASRANRVPGEGVVVGTSNVLVTTADQYEAGVKVNLSTLSIFATGFFTKYKPYSATLDGINPGTGLFERLQYVGEAESPGVEVAANWRPLRWARLDASVTYNDAKITNLTDAEGNLPLRQPKIYGYVMPTLSFTPGGIETELYGRYNFVGRRFTDAQNTTALPAYQTITLGITARKGPWEVQVVGDNIFNEFGLSEGNPRSDQLSGQGTPEAVFGRPIYGRNFRLVVTRNF
jgi:iron complex outermembrane receptor protein